MAIAWLETVSWPSLWLPRKAVVELPQPWDEICATTKDVGFYDTGKQKLAWESAVGPNVYLSIYLYIYIHLLSSQFLEKDYSWKPSWNGHFQTGKSLAPTSQNQLHGLLEDPAFIEDLPKEVNAMLLLPYQSTKFHVLLEETMASKGKVRVRLMKCLTRIPLLMISDHSSITIPFSGFNMF